MAEQTTHEHTDPSVPTELLDLHVQLEEADVSPKKFKEAYGDAAGNKS